MSASVSVIIGTYNRERYIRETLESVFAQTFTEYEVIVVDDASTDGTLDILASYGERIRLCRRERNSGHPAVPRNVGFGMARGKYIALLDSDDIWLPEKLEKQVKVMEHDARLGMCHAYSQFIDCDGVRGEIRHEGVVPTAAEGLSRELLRFCFIVTSNVLIRRDALDKVGLMSEDPMLRNGEDYEWFMRIAASQRVAFIDEVLALYRKAETGISRTDCAWRVQPRNTMVLEYVLRQPDMTRYGCLARTEVRDTFMDHLIVCAQFWRDDRFPIRSAWFLLRGLQRKCWDHRCWLHLAKTCFRVIVPAIRVSGGS